MSNNMSLGCIYSCCLSSFDPISAVILCVLCLQHFKLSDDLLTLSVCVCDFLRPIFLLSTLKEYKKVGLSILYFKKPFKNAERVCRVCGGGVTSTVKYRETIWTRAFQSGPGPHTGSLTCNISFHHSFLSLSPSLKLKCFDFWLFYFLNIYKMFEMFR